jgi:hypothetical protein
MNAIGLLHLRDIFWNYQGDNGMETNEETLARLKFISFIQKDEKINVRQVGRQPNTLLTKISRTILYPDNRYNGLKFIRDVMNRSFEILENYILRKQWLSARAVVTDMLRAKQGIINLRYTYGDDTKYCCDLDVLLNNLSDRLIQIKDKEPALFAEAKDSFLITQSLSNSPPMRPGNPFDLANTSPPTNTLTETAKQVLMPSISLPPQVVSQATPQVASQATPQVASQATPQVALDTNQQLPDIKTPTPIYPISQPSPN